MYPEKEQTILLLFEVHAYIMYITEMKNGLVK